MSSTIDLINKLYDEFIELKERTIAMDRLGDSESKELIHGDTCGTDKIVVSISTNDIDSEVYELYLDIVELHKLGYDIIDTDKYFDRINISTFFFNLEEEYLSYFHRRLRYAIVHYHHFDLSLYKLLSVKFSKCVIERIRLLKYILNNYNYDVYNHISYQLNDIELKKLDDYYDVNIFMYLSFYEYGEDKFRIIN